VCLCRHQMVLRFRFSGVSEFEFLIKFENLAVLRG
jgi:hypothetical protein